MSGIDLGRGLRGWLDSPADGARLEETVPIRGWVLSADQRVRHILVRSGRRHWSIPPNTQRPDVTDALGTSPPGHLAGFDGSIPLGPGLMAFTVHAVLDDGTEHRCFERTVVGLKTQGPVSPAAYLSQASRRAVTAWREGRLDLDPGIIRKHLRNLRREMQEQSPQVAPPQSPAGDIKAGLERLYSTMLRELLRTNARLVFEAPPAPDVTVILVLFNRAELTLRCLRSLAEIHSSRIEVLIVDNASTDDTSALLSRLDGVQVIANSTNEGFLRAVNQAAPLARGRTILLLNNDAELMPGSLAAALSTLDREPRAGAVVGRLVFPDGKLQEAGSLIWRDGSCLGYGRGDDPQAPPYQFQRDVDYGSGAFLLTTEALWRELGGFDDQFAPAYYEDADYCARVWQSGRRVIYEPRALAVHFEFASSPSRANAIALQSERRGLFVEKHKEWLASRLPANTDHVLQARSADKKPRVLVLDDRVPHPHLGAGFPRARELLKALEELGWAVTLHTLSDRPEPWESVYEDLPRTIEVMCGPDTEPLRRHLTERDGFYDCILVSRPHNMKRLLSALTNHRGQVPPIVYDAEAIFADREEAERRLHGRASSPESVRAAAAAEVALADKAAAVIAVSPQDVQRFMREGHSAHLVGHALAPTPTAPGFAERQGLLFVGALNGPESPNVDSVRWLVREILPRVADLAGRALPVTIVGETRLDEVLSLQGPGVQLLGRVDDLTSIYSQARVFVAPTRFAAGLPYKVHHAAAHGIPIVCTSLIAGQVGWSDRRELLAADDADGMARALIRLHEDQRLWEAIRATALVRIATDCGRESFLLGLRGALRQAAPEASERASWS